MSEGVRVVHLHARRLLLGVPALARYLRRERPVAMLTCLDYVNIVGLWARRLAGVRVRVVVNEQNTLSMAVRNSSRWRTRMMPWLIRRFYPWADGVVAVSKGVADDLAAATGLPRARVQVIHNPVVTPLMRHMMAEPLEYPWFRPGGPPVILALGRLVPQKDFGMLIRAFARLRRARAARLIMPRQESWLPFEQDVVAARYLQTLVGT